VTASAPQVPAGSLEAAAQEFRECHEVAGRPARDLPVRSRLVALPEWLERARAACAEPPPEATKAAEWLLDNDYLMQRAVLQIQEDLPAGFYRQLPSLASGEAEGLPRAFAVAHGLLQVSRLQISLSVAVRFVSAYQNAASQTEGTLTIGELWAFPTMLRLACLELVVTALGRLIPEIEAAFPATPLVASQGSLDDTECVARGLANLGVIASIPWKDFFGQTSRVEAILCSGDPAGVYSRMDFETRDCYRREVEALAGDSACSEPAVANRVVELARAADRRAPKADHVGHWLVGEGRGELERSLGYTPPFRAACGRWLLDHAAPLYALALIGSTAAAETLPALYLRASGAGPGLWLLGMVVALLPASVVGITLVHWVATRIAPPRVLPKLDFGKGIAPESSTAVVVPVLVASLEEVAPLVERLEGHSLANPDPTLQFALLSDYADADGEHEPGDEVVLGALVEGIRQLNARHGREGRGPFHVLHRPRRYNPAEGCWMGWERKRGKLEELNDLLSGGGGDAFSTHEGDLEALLRVRFVVTVDADTLLPPGSVARLVGTLAHPLNRAEFDEETGRVRSGYTVVQPRVEISPQAGTRSLFARLYSGDTALDIYTRAVSDVYQDLLGVGIYVGKGIYDVVAFRRSLEGRVPENALASHDLFEGIHGRVALATDIVLYEGFPSGYVEFTRRWHRWLRGDWALLPWLARSVPGRNEASLSPRLSWLARWMILDNLRRSLLPPSLVALLAAGWLILPGSPWVWSGLAVAAPGAYLFSDLVTGLARVGGWRRGAVRTVRHHLADHVGRWLLALVFLAQDAGVALDAIGRTLWRLFVSHRRLLQWTSAAHTAARVSESESRTAVWRELWISPAFALALGIAIGLHRPAALPSAAPLLLLWLISPEIGLLLGRRRLLRTETLGLDERRFLRQLARRTWLFFETFVGPDDHWLPPDNFQEDPGGELAHRTSPTNVGMLLLSTLAACDLGYLGLPELAARLRNSLDVLDRLPGYRGHLFNWYDTRSLEPLEPRYVSTVDSGNLAVSLLTVKEGCRELTTGPVFRVAEWEGLEDGLALLTEALAALPGGGRGDLYARVTSIAAQVSRARGTPDAWRHAVMYLCECECPELDCLLMRAIEVPGGVGPETLREVRIWLGRVHHHLRSMQRDLETLLPWSALVSDPPPGCDELAAEILALLPATVPLDEIGDLCARARAAIDRSGTGSQGDGAAARWRGALAAALEAGARNAADLRQSLLDLAARAEARAFSMDFRLLYDEEPRLFYIGYNASVDRLDPHHYDLLASEARLASFFAIAKGDVPLEHWFFLGRPLAEAHGRVMLVSWGGSMFEYLMPPLVLRSRRETLLGQSERMAVEAQQRYARKLGAPWGMSESGFASLSPERHYRYRAFGVPGLGLRRGLSRDLVVAPYATALALSVLPETAVANLHELEQLGMVGCYGLFEAVDFTPDRVPEGHRFRPVRSYMAHHQGMILTALDNALAGDVLVRRFHADRRVRAVELLLDERVPRELPPQAVRAEEHAGPEPRRRAGPAPAPWTPPARAAFPQLQALGNGRLSSWITEAGGGGLHWQGQALTRWLPDAARDADGLWIYVRDEESGALWSVGRQPTGVASPESQVVFHAHLVELHRRDHGIAIGMEVGITPGDDVEIRRLTVVNESDRPRRLLLTSYGEVVLAPSLEDERHPAFSKLFVHSEALPAQAGLLFGRRPRQPRERPAWLLHRVVADDEGLPVIGFETDRRTFLGRNGSARCPRGVLEGLGGSVGWTLDPAMALQVRLELEPQQRRQLAFVTMASGSRESLLELAERHATLSALDWSLSDAGAEAVRELQRTGLDPARLPELQVLVSLLLQPHPALRAEPAVLRANRLGQPRLWGLGISGDLPILLLRASDPSDTALLRVLLQGHQLWRRRGIHVDLVVLRTGVSGYAEPLRERLFELLQETGAQELMGRRGGVHLLFADQMGDEERRLVEAVARVVLDDHEGFLDRQLAGAAAPRAELPRFEPTGDAALDEPVPPLTRPEGLLYDNGFGGFSEDGCEYVIHLEPGDSTPVPWSNVLANDDCGSVVTESGLGFTWAGNSGENRLTPWTCDPVADPPGEVLYLRDEETAAIWTPTPRPAGAAAACQIRHGAGYTEWRQDSHGLEQQLRVFVPSTDPVKVARLELRNTRARPRRITVTYFAEWLLGALRSASREHVVCEYDPGLCALLARNPWAPDFAEASAFLASSLPPHGLTTDRQEFLGREGDPRLPAGLVRWGLSGRVAPGGDPCAALQVHLEIAPGGTAEVVFVLGQGRDRAQVEGLVQRWRDREQVEAGWKEQRRCWDERLSAVQVKTPDQAFDLMMNRWLPYQVLASRVLARAGFYQAGGAIGFRDQLQDHLALAYSEPDRLRRHILACAAHQFEEGDVLHWWHPPTGRGVRTRCSDDLLWLPYAVAYYVEATGEASILDEEVPFLRAPPLAPDEHDRYAAFDVGPERRSLFEHCERALERGVTRGAHGLPLIGAGDWNDGMDRVGRRGRGESVWLAWFAIETIGGFIGLCERRGEKELAEGWRRRAGQLERAVEDTAWDGKWYVRAFDDDGRPWGSAACDECRIDSISQSWSALAGGSAPERVREALRSAETELVREGRKGEGDGEAVIRLLWPPFDATPRDPGYIRAYPPGIRENGGQYTHAAAWLGWAFAEIGDRERAARILELLNPIRHAASRAGAEHYRAEPYVLAADLGGVPPHAGRAGWTWYTGSAAWTWRFGLERILGLQLRNGDLVIDPCLPPAWDGFAARIRGPAGTLSIRVEDPEGIGRGRVNGPLAFPVDGSTRRVHVRLEPAEQERASEA
jgi:cyclic beta-1,2-glucan synthetase